MHFEFLDVVRLWYVYSFHTQVKHGICNFPAHVTETTIRW